MQKNLVALFVLISISSSLFAQIEKQFEFGANVGYNSSTVTNGRQTNSVYRSSFNIGLSAEYYFSNRWGVKTKLIYDNKGWNKGYLSTPNTTITTNYKVTYITVPVMANWHFGKKRNWYLNFGPYIGFLTSASETVLHTNLKEYFTTVDAGFDFGIGVKIPISEKARFFIEYGRQGGFTGIFKEIDPLSPSIRNSRISFNVGAYFDLK